MVSLRDKPLGICGERIICVARNIRQTVQQGNYYFWTADKAQCYIDVPNFLKRD